MTWDTCNPKVGRPVTDDPAPSTVRMRLHRARKKWTQLSLWGASITPGRKYETGLNRFDVLRIVAKYPNGVLLSQIQKHMLEPKRHRVTQAINALWLEGKLDRYREIPPSGIRNSTRPFFYLIPPEAAPYEPDPRKREQANFAAERARAMVRRAQLKGKNA